MLSPTYLSGLGDSDAPLTASRLACLSHLDRREQALLAQVWPSYDVNRRREIAQRLIELAEEDVQLDFRATFYLCLEDEDAEVRVEGIDGLWEVEEHALVQPLLVHLRQDNSPEVRAAAATALGRLLLLAEEGKLLAKDGVKLKGALFSVLEDESEEVEVRRRALEALAPLGTPQAGEAVRRAYGSKERLMKVSALFAMGRHGDAAWLPILIREMGSQDPEFRFEAARACGKLEREEAIPALRALIRDTDIEVRLATVQALGNIGGDEAKAILRGLLHSRNDSLRQAAQEALETLSFAQDPPAFGLFLP